MGASPVTVKAVQVFASDTGEELKSDSPALTIYPTCASRESSKTRQRPGGMACLTAPEQFDRSMYVGTGAVFGWLDR
jgi:hypothetical protein